MGPKQFTHRRVLSPSLRRTRLRSTLVLLLPTMLLLASPAPLAPQLASHLDQPLALLLVLPLPNSLLVAALLPTLVLVAALLPTLLLAAVLLPTLLLAALLPSLLLAALLPSL